MRALLQNNPEYQAVTVIKADWDTYRNTPIINELGVRRRSTLIVFNEGKEVARVVAQSQPNAIEALFQAVL